VRRSARRTDFAAVLGPGSRRCQQYVYRKEAEWRK
jgi:hypothetical protein